ncbi:MAG: hypothetical protein EA389_01755 [Ilumatobacter sp.]|nr:MAG: hypothetical protein EA389_01755 [Ilumatobacter sp.]
MFVGLGIILLVLGGILAFAVSESLEGIDLVMVGWILIAGGVLSLVIGAIQGLGWMTARRTQMRTERHMSDDGQHYVEETRAD